MTPPNVTVICATRNAREAVRLTFLSFRRHTEEPCTVLVADNNSTDGALGELRCLSWLTVFSAAERRELVRIESQRGRGLTAAPDALLRGYAGTAPSPQRAFLESLRAGLAERDVEDGAEWDHERVLTSHGSALDWLAARVRTPFFLTLDSDVEFLAPGWLTEMLEVMERRQLVALGEYEPGWGGHRPRLAPHLLLLRTDGFRVLGTTFHGFTEVRDPEEARRWRARPASFNLSPDEGASYRSASFYSTGAAFFESLVQSGARWSPIPESIKKKFLHLGHMSWADQADEEGPGPGGLAREYRSHLAYVRDRLRLYGVPYQRDHGGGG